jgi:hypothetical protein
MASVPFTYPWYLPPVAMMGLVTIVCACRVLSAYLNKRFPKPHRPWFIYAVAPLALYMLSLLILVSINTRIHQRLIEDGTRRQVGLWLHENAAPGDRVYLECLGYIGYFSECRMLDYPGLATPEVSRLIREDGHDFVSLVEVLKPEWLALRIYEVTWMQKSKYFRENYLPVKEFNSCPALAEWIRLPGCTMYYDAYFIVFKRQGNADTDSNAGTESTAAE